MWLLSRYLWLNHHWINSQTVRLTIYSKYSSPWGEMSKINLVTCLFSLLWSTLIMLWNAHFQGFTPYQIQSTSMWCRLFLTGWFDHSWVLSCVFLSFILVVIIYYFFSHGTFRSLLGLLARVPRGWSVWWWSGFPWDWFIFFLWPGCPVSWSVFIIYFSLFYL